MAMADLVSSTHTACVAFSRNVDVYMVKQSHASLKVLISAMITVNERSLAVSN